MKALMFDGVRTVRHGSSPDPEITDPRDALVRVEWTAICGSDLHIYHGRETGLDRGTVMGHEFLGEVVEVGGEVDSVRAGAKVVSPFTTSCGTCFYCRRGLTCRCSAGELYGWVQDGAGLHGAQSEYVRVPLADSTLVDVPAGAAPEEALFAGDILSTGWFCADAGGAGPDTVVAVVGCGPVGLMAALAARELGAKTVLAIDGVAERLELARSYGAEPLDFNQLDVVAEVRARTEGRGADVVLEAVGSPQASRSAIDLVRPGGTISAAGVHTEEHFAFSPTEVYDKNVTYKGGRCPARHYMDRALELVASKRYDLSAIVSHRLPLADGARAYDIFDRKLESCTKVLLAP